MKNGELIILPTDTVYGLAAKLYDKEALEKIYQLKGREQSKQIPILCAKIEDLDEIAIISDDAKKLMLAFWPGAITFVLSTTQTFYEKTGEKTIAARIPNHKLALRLIETYGVLRATSLNKSGEPPMDDMNQIINIFGSDVHEIYEQNETPSHVSSTVIDVSGEGFKMLRAGTITERDIQAVLTDK